MVTVSTDRRGMTMIRPIPTTYKGIKFRSKLEAQWAKFFDHIGIEWLYEPEGFVLDNGLCYQPDFELKMVDSWCSKPVYFEVKADAYSLTKTDINKLFGFITCKTIDPNDDSYYVKQNIYVGDSTGCIYDANSFLIDMLKAESEANSQEELEEGNSIAIDLSQQEICECPHCGSKFFDSYVFTDYSYCPKCGSDLSINDVIFPRRTSRTHFEHKKITEVFRAITQIDYRS